MAAFPRALSVVVLFGINLLNYIDRWTVAGVLSDMQMQPSRGGFGISDAEGGLLTSMFILTYMVFSPVFGYFGDRMNRTAIIFIGVAAWSSAVFVGSFATTFPQLLACRAMVGVGEASYANVAPTLIADMYPIDERTRILSFYFVAVPVGSALGFILGGQASLYLGWRWAFRITPGISLFLASLLCVFMREPPRGLSDGRVHVSEYANSNRDSESLGAAATVLHGSDEAVPLPVASSEEVASNSSSAKGWWHDVRDVWSVRSFMWSTFGLTSVTFVMGALAQWGPSYLHRVSCSKLASGGALNASTSAAVAACKSDINLIFGLISCVTGVAGTFLGSALSRTYTTERNAADAILCALGLLVATPFVFLGVYFAPRDATLAWVMIFVAELMLGIIWVPVTAMLLYVISPLQRATASGMQTMFSHLFGDASSPVLVGYIADSLVHSGAAASRSDALQQALYPAALFCFLGALCFGMATSYLAEDRRTQNSVVPLNKSYSQLPSSPMIGSLPARVVNSSKSSLELVSVSPSPPSTAAGEPLATAGAATGVDSLDARSTDLRRR
uniref:Major facilitator superfamily (MFS) profile domain-containing protein n=1 Tax=Erythrolobus australicus TaxID=1077150 RepID=A0A7S1TMP1_9RHOD|mmetsp:Transcript_718/g.1861  ORF Transcript_718/g.1861 Transcript_718/m.1861 type:complete len:560 (+) Transcript_718:341-2020(+)